MAAAHSHRAHGIAEGRILLFIQTEIGIMADRPLDGPKQSILIPNSLPFVQARFRVVGQFESVLKGRDFSRAVSRIKRAPALAAEGWVFQTGPLPASGLLLTA